MGDDHHSNINSCQRCMCYSSLHASLVINPLLSYILILSKIILHKTVEVLDIRIYCYPYSTRPKAEWKVTTDFKELTPLPYSVKLTMQWVRSSKL